MKLCTALLLVIVSLVDINADKSKHPEQIHLSLGGKSSEMMVTFTVFHKSDKSQVKYRKLGGNDYTVEAEVTKFEDTNKKDSKYESHMHRALLIGLEPSQTYEYKCGADDHWSDWFQFRTQPEGTDSVLRVAVVADLGLEEQNGVSIPRLKRDVKKGLYDSIFHIGDIAYNLNKDGGSVGDKFLNQIQDFAATVPYQVCPGNHERKRNFTHYLNRFSMVDQSSGQIQNHYYSTNMGSAHFIFYSTELYYYTEWFTESHLKWQYDWLENDLKEANKPENRAQRPWIIVMGHRPMYCLLNDAIDKNEEDGDDSVDKDCFENEAITRNGKYGPDFEGLRQGSQYGLEELFNKYGVDVELYGHKHLYARSYPVYKFNTTKSYVNPRAPVQIITGVGGTTDRPSFKKTLPDWVAFYKPDFGFTRMTIQNKTHIFFEQYSVEKDEVIDNFVLSKDRSESRTR